MGRGTQPALCEALWAKTLKLPSNPVFPSFVMEMEGEGERKRGRAVIGCCITFCSGREKLTLLVHNFRSSLPNQNINAFAKAGKTSDPNAWKVIYLWNKRMRLHIFCNFSISSLKSICTKILNEWRRQNLFSLNAPNCKTWDHIPVYRHSWTE